MCTVWGSISSERIRHAISQSFDRHRSTRVLWASFLKDESPGIIPIHIYDYILLLEWSAFHCPFHLIEYTELSNNIKASAAPHAAKSCRWEKSLYLLLEFQLEQKLRPPFLCFTSEGLPWEDQLFFLAVQIIYILNYRRHKAIWYCFIDMAPSLVL